MANQISINPEGCDFCHCRYKSPTTPLRINPRSPPFLYLTVLCEIAEEVMGERTEETIGGGAAHLSAEAGEVLTSAN